MVWGRTAIPTSCWARRDQTKELIELYRETAAAEGYEMGPQHIGYLIRCLVADSSEKAQELGYNFFWQNGALNKQIREWMAPPGYATIDVAGIRRLRAVSKAFDNQAYQEAQDNYQLILGTPKEVEEKVRHVRDLLGVDHIAWSRRLHDAKTPCAASS